MRRMEHQLARALTALGLAATVAWLVWRALYSMDGVAWWAAAPLYVIEVVGFLAAAVLAWALWPAPHRGIDEIDDDPESAAAAAAAIGLSAADVVIRASGHPAHEVRATLIAVRRVRHAGLVTVIDRDGSAEVGALCAEFGAIHVVPTGDVRVGVPVLEALGAPLFLYLDAGDIPSPDIIGLLAPHLVDRSVAIVQGQGQELGDSRGERGADRCLEPGFERRSLNPALSRRGTAMWTGSGSLVRADDMRDVMPMVPPARSPLEAQWQASAALARLGRKVVAPVAPVFVRAGHVDDAAVYVDRVQRARGARELLFGTVGALRPVRHVPFRARLSAVAWSVRSLSGFRRAAFVAVLCSVILSGHVPFHATWVELAAGWLPAMLYTSLGLALLSGWTLRPGARTRWSLHTLGAACTSVRPGTPERTAGSMPVLAMPSVRYGCGLLVVSVAVGVAMAMRSVSELATGALGPMPVEAMVVAMAVGVWTMAVAVDLLWRLVRRGRERRSTRVVTALSAVFDGRGVTILDLAATGAGLVTRSAPALGHRAVLDTSLTTMSGVTDVMIEAEVRNVIRLRSREWRVGVAFHKVVGSTADALAEFCMVEPVWERLGVVPGRSVTEARPMVAVPDPDQLLDFGPARAGQSGRPSS